MHTHVHMPIRMQNMMHMHTHTHTHTHMHLNTDTHVHAYIHASFYPCHLTIFRSDIADVVKVLPLGNSRSLPSLSAVLEAADYVTLHVPMLPETQNMITEKEISRMK